MKDLSNIHSMIAKKINNELKKKETEIFILFENRDDNAVRQIIDSVAGDLIDTYNILVDKAKKYLREFKDVKRLKETDYFEQYQYYSNSEQYYLETVNEALDKFLSYSRKDNVIMRK